ncbi:MAG: peptidase M28, partial [Bacteroidales bacterium]|nr:peptidase M28 [Bacteroidales bacterium]
MKRIFASALVTMLVISCAVSAYAQDKVVKKIIETGTTDNRAMVHIDHLANRIGGRPIGSAALTEAEAWAKEQFESWGLEVMVQEAGEINVGFNRGPWFGRMLGDESLNLHFATPAYTAGTRGKQSGHVLIEPKSRRELERMKGALKGAWVLLDAESDGMAINTTPAANAKRAEVIAKNEEIDRENNEIRRWNYEHRDSEPKKLKEYEKSVAP